MSIVCPTKPNKYYKRLAKEIGDTGAYHYFERNGYTQPESDSDVDAIVKHFNESNKQEELLQKSKSVDYIVDKLMKDQDDIYLPQK